MFMFNEFNEVKMKKKIVLIFQKENGNTFTLLILFIVKSLQKEQNSTNIPPICRHKRKSPQIETTPRRLTLLSLLKYICFFMTLIHEKVLIIKLG